jgi:hypothetical protein
MLLENLHHVAGSLQQDADTLGSFVASQASFAGKRSARYGHMGATMVASSQANKVQMLNHVPESISLGPSVSVLELCVAEPKSKPNLSSRPIHRRLCPRLRRVTLDTLWVKAAPGGSLATEINAQLVQIEQRLNQEIATLRAATVKLGGTG